MSALRGIAPIAIIFLAIPCAGQQPAASPAASQAPAIPSTGFAGLDQYRASRIAVFTDDYGQLARYRSANAELKAPAASENRVVFFGDSITDNWKLEQYFPGKPYINRGIGGQTTPQMLVRFRQDVIELSPKVVVILAGTNDIAGNTGPMRNEDIEANLSSMAELAREHAIRVVLSSILPVHNYTPPSQEFFAQRPPERVLAKTPAPPALGMERIGKETAAGILPPVYFLFNQVVSRRSFVVGQKTNRQRPTANDLRPCLFTTNSAAPSPICGSPSPTGAITSVSIAGRGMKARSMATCRLPIICAWRACWWGWALQRSG